MKNLCKSVNKMLFFMTGLTSGGGERVTIDVMNHFSKSNEVILVAMNYEGVYVGEISSRVRVIDLKTKTFRLTVIRLIKIIKKIQPNVVFSSSIHSNILLLLSLVFIYRPIRSVVRVGVPLSITFDSFRSFFDRYAVPFLTKILYRRASVVIAVSRGIARDIFQTIKLKTAKVIYNPKDWKAISLLASTYVPVVFQKNQGPFIVFVGRLVAAKDLETLVRAFDVVQKKSGGHLVLVGGGGEQEKITLLVKKLGIIHCVSFEGSQPNPYVYMKNADVFVSSSRWEGLSNVVIEALICGARVVATDCPGSGSREILAPNSDCLLRLDQSVEEVENGFLVPVQRFDLLAEAIIRSLIKPKTVFDPGRFSYERTMNQYAQALIGFDSESSTVNTV